MATPDGAIVRGDDGVRRCFWGASTPDYIAYHDDEWGRPVVDDVRLFEKISLEGFQSGLSWLTILRKREGFRRAFVGFDPARVALVTACHAATRRRGHRPSPRQDQATRANAQPAVQGRASGGAGRCTSCAGGRAAATGDSRRLPCRVHPLEEPKPPGSGRVRRHRACADAAAGAGMTTS
jgi:hypothetical protein